MKKSAFTMVELVFVIVVIGIITAVMLPRIDRDNVYEAAQQVVSHIKYTQHLAMIDNKFDDTNVNWYKERWQIAFTKCTAPANVMYSIHSDKAAYGVLPARTEAALDPLSRLPLYHNNCNPVGGTDDDKVDLGNNYNITSIDVSGCLDINGAQVRRIAFDILGRPFSNISTATSPTQTYIPAACDIILVSDVDSNVTIRIEAETGYAHVVGIN